MSGHLHLTLSGSTLALKLKDLQDIGNLDHNPSGINRDMHPGQVLLRGRKERSHDYTSQCRRWLTGDKNQTSQQNTSLRAQQLRDGISRGEVLFLRASRFIDPAESASPRSNKFVGAERGLAHDGLRDRHFVVPQALKDQTLRMIRKSVPSMRVGYCNLDARGRLENHSP
ncbi:hypothetical protein BKA93DRAFT_189625 [Sparassis latifolia]